MRIPSDGSVCWYELCTPDPVAAGAFYKHVLDWDMNDTARAGRPHMVASAGGTLIGAVLGGLDRASRPDWMFYFSVEDCAALAAAVRAAGGQVLVSSVEGSESRPYAVLTDPQGAAFGIFQRLPGEAASAFNPQRPGHGHWHELSTSNPQAAMGFYRSHFRLHAGERYELPGLGHYHGLVQGRQDFGAIAAAAPPGQEGGGTPGWRVCFGVERIAPALQRIRDAGGQVLTGPLPCPGGAWMAQARDPLGARFAISAPS